MPELNALRAEVARRTGAPLLDFTCSPLTAGAHAPGRSEDMSMAAMLGGMALVASVALLAACAQTRPIPVADASTVSAGGSSTGMTVWESRKPS